MKDERDNKPRFEKLKNFIKTKAPNLLHKIGDFVPNTGAIGIVKNIILSALPNEISDTDKKEALDILNKEAEIFYKEVEDISNARAMQIEALKQDDKFSKRFIYYLSIFVMISATGFGVGLMFFEIPESNRRLIEMFADIYLFAGAIMILQFFFGASHKLGNNTK